jgi:hypothetical protein
MAMALVARIKADRPLQAVLADLADGLYTDRAAFQAQALPLVRGLVEQHFLVPARPTSNGAAGAVA